MYATCLQFDVLFPLKEYMNNYEIGFSDANEITDEAILKDFFRIIIHDVPNNSKFLSKYCYFRDCLIL